MSEANQIQVGGTHYKTNGEEHWDRVNRLGLDYFQAQVTKYVERCWKKNGVEDLKKARHFLDKYIELKINDSKLAQPGPGYGVINTGPDGGLVGYASTQGGNAHWQNEGYYGDGTCLYSCRKCKATERLFAAPVHPHGCGVTGALEASDTAL